MDLVGDMLLQTLRREHSEIAPVELRPSMRARFGHLQRAGLGRNADRLIARFIDYPRWLRSTAPTLSVYHLVDHSYAQLVHSLPAERTVVTCHDLDTFRSVLQPELEPRSWLFRRMTRRILTGLQQAARVTCDSIATRDAVLAHELLPADRLDVVYLGVDPAMSHRPDPRSDAFVESLLGPATSRAIDLLHVGSTIPRKRIDLLLRIVAAVRARIRETRLIRVGGPFTEAQRGLARDLGLDSSSVIVMPYLDRPQLAAVYRRAAVVLQPSEAEGFGLPVVEALACGAPVVASDLPVLREVGGDVAAFCPVGDIDRWSGTVCAMVREHRGDPLAAARRREVAVQWSARFSWTTFADRMAEIYQTIAASGPDGSLPRPER
jgi:glycosyltransferase involved in cell wall biosynthesis